MVVSHKVNLPTDEELTVQEINLSTSALKAGAFHLGKKCELENNEFSLCRFEEADPRKCLNEGKAVTGCALSFFQDVKKSCYEEFTQYAKCLNTSGSDMRYDGCRNTQGVFDKCMLDNLGIARPEYGYFTRIKVHHTNRPKPVEPPAVYPDTPKPRAPRKDLEELPPANFGARNVL